MQFPPNPAESSGNPTYILASRIIPHFSPSTTQRPGVQQILLLPKVSKACILCNSTVTFYSLPELSPVYGNTSVHNCNWVGGLDLNDVSIREAQDTDTATVTVLLSLKKILRPIKVGSEAKGLKVRHRLQQRERGTDFAISQSNLQGAQSLSVVMPLHALPMDVPMLS